MFRGTPSRPSLYSLLRGPICTAERCRGTYSTVLTCNWSPYHYYGVGAPTSVPLICRLLNTACSPMEAVGLTTGSWEKTSFAHAGTGADRAPDTGPGARLLACGIVDNQLQLVSIALVCCGRGTLCKIAAASSGELCWRPLN
jgi:hypothetical protein